MNIRKKYWFKGIAVFMAIQFLNLLITPGILSAQNTGPVAPEAVAFEPVDATDMVNLLSGDVSYVLPILNVPSPEGGYPLALSYHAGITLDQEASWVGLGWTVNPGAINRSVKGYPDDWKDQQVISLLQLPNQTSEVYNLGIGVSYQGLSVGLNGSWGTHKAFGGSVSLGYTPGGAGLGFQASLGQNTSIGVTYKGAGLGAGAGINLDGQVYTSASASAIGTGISFASLGSSASFTVAGESVPLAQTVGASDWNVKAYTQGGSLLPSASFIDVSFQTTTYDFSLYNESSKTINGPLYFYNSYHSVGSTPGSYDYSRLDGSYLMDVYTNSYDGWRYNGNSISSETGEIINEDDNASKNVFMFPAYDKYIVSAQGISGSMKPRLLEYGELFGESKELERHPADPPHWLTNHQDYPDGNRMNSQEYNRHPGQEITKTENQIYFNFDHENSSYLKVGGGNYYYSNSGAYDPLWDVQSTPSTFESQLNGKSHYNSSTKRKGGGKYTEWFKNSDIEHNLALLKSKGFIETQSLENLRIDNNFYDPDGIGAYSITTEDGKTYHYSLPVYQFEQIFTDENSVDGTKFMEKKLAKYAYTWLLTAITGPDYVDDGDGFVDDGDYGYWVNLEYGKWTDGYFWKTPYNGAEANGDHSTVSLGRKQIYYLNSIKTRTHTAYFIKDIREDGLSMDDYSFTMNEYAHRQGTGSWGTGNFQDCTPGSGNVHSSAYRYDLQYTTTIDMPVRNRVLKLDKIVLVSNEDANLSTNNVHANLTPDYYASGTIHDQIDITNVEIVNNGSSQINDVYCLQKDVQFNMHYQNNVLDVADILPFNYNNLINNAIKVIDFNHDYSLNTGTPNSAAPATNDYAAGGKLTLKNVKILGTGGADVFPDYQFKYQDIWNYCANCDNNWGHYQGGSFVEAWSLKEILTPTGSKIKIEYEPDSYYTSAINTNTAVYNGNGGLRAREIVIEDELGNNYITEYDYSSPITNLTSGITSYTPSKEARYIPYVHDIPGPSVMYEYVTVKNKGLIDMSRSEKTYHFQVLKPSTNPNSGSFDMGNIFQVDNTENTLFSDEPIHPFSSHYHTALTRNTVIHDNSSSIGRLLSISVKDDKGLLANKLEYKYKSNSELKQGIVQESFKYTKRYTHFVNVNNQESHNLWSSNTSSKIEYPSVLSSVSNSEMGGAKKTLYYSDYDFKSGKNLTTKYEDSWGNQYRTESVPAYLVNASGYYPYAKMGSKVDYVTNKNMLIQDAETYLYQSNTSGNDDLVSASVQTWNDDWSYREIGWNNQYEDVQETQADFKIWRKHKNYIWKALIDGDGTYKTTLGPDQFVEYDWSATATYQNPNWKKINEVTRYDRFSHPLESKDIVNKYVGTKMGYKRTRVLTSVANAKFVDFGYSGAEDAVINDYFGGEILKGASGVVYNGTAISNGNKYVHTGDQSLRVPYNANGFIYRNNDYSASKNRRYRASVWVHEDNSFGASLLVVMRPNATSGAITLQKTEVINSSTPKAGEWYLLEIDIPNVEDYPTLTSAQFMEVRAFNSAGGLGGDMYFDDFMVHPATAPMTSYVYDDKTGLVTAIIGNKGMAVKYEYDDAGRLTASYKEILNKGFVKTAEHRYNYARQ